MTAAILSTANIASGGTFTAAAGSNRLIVAAGNLRRDTGTPVITATFGGVSMQIDVSSGFVGDDILLQFSLPEASIPSGAQTFTVSAASGGTILDPFAGQIYTLGGRKQTSYLDSGFTSNGSASAATSVTTASLTNVAHSCLIATVRNSTGDAITDPSGWTRRQGNTGSGGICVVDDHDDASAATGTYAWSSVSNSWIYVTAAYLAAASGSNFLTRNASNGGMQSQSGGMRG